MRKENSYAAYWIYAALIASVLVVASSVYFIQSLSYSIGYASSIQKILSNYNLTKSLNITLASVSATLTLMSMALYITYILFILGIVMAFVSLKWIFGYYGRTTAVILALMSFFSLLLVGLLSNNFHFSGSIDMIFLAYIGGVCGILSGTAILYISYGKKEKYSKSIEINPETPYSNMQILSNKIIKNMHGSLSIQDMHFDINSIRNLSRMLKDYMQNFKTIRILTFNERLDDEFRAEFRDFKNELSNYGINIELKIINPIDAQKQHERLIFDDYKAYKIPPLNIINKKREHIVKIPFEESKEYFEKMWDRGIKLDNLKQ
ncbi:MAG: hypothetical protein ACP5RP_03435 [Candidatus Micrarchaeia archaeon]